METSVGFFRLAGLAACLLGLWLLSAVGAGAEPFCPEANIKIVAPFPPGGPTDVTARLLAE
jgi:tripartite-type tricarboxylate transporter receptor subunit TctC